MLACYTQSDSSAIPVVTLTTEKFSEWLAKQSAVTKNWIESQAFTAKSGAICQIPNAHGKLQQIIVGLSNINDFFALGNLSTTLPQGKYQLSEWNALGALTWGMGAYQFTKYKAANKKISQLVLPKECDKESLDALIRAIYLVRDLINTPTEDLGPAQLAQTAENIANEFKAQFSQIVGDDLLNHNYPAIHAVGRASAQAPRLIDIRWGDPKLPKVTLVGKGVCFDSGGLDLKPANNMALMKKDMGGAAHVLGLAYLIMRLSLPIRLRVLIPAVENAVSGNAFRPGDVIKTRKGLNIEIGNTDAEGRVILADALTEASSENPDLIIDIATLTGAARVALGTDLPAMFTNNDELANKLFTLGQAIQDPVWRMPLHTPYRKLIESNIADLNNAAEGGYAGAIVAALFLKEFVPDSIKWAHFDIMAWNISALPGRPVGGEAMGLRAIFDYLHTQYMK